jgi:ABC-2 type transport system ATP-binding protein
VHDRVAALSQVVRALHERDIAVEDITLRRPTLDEVFLRLTGTGPETASETAGREKETVR